MNAGLATTTGACGTCGVDRTGGADEVDESGGLPTLAFGGTNGTTVLGWERAAGTEVALDWIVSITNG